MVRFSHGGWRLVLPHPLQKPGRLTSSAPVLSRVNCTLQATFSDLFDLLVYRAVRGFSRSILWRTSLASTSVASNGTSALSTRYPTYVFCRRRKSVGSLTWAKSPGRAGAPPTLVPCRADGPGTERPGCLGSSKSVHPSRTQPSWHGLISRAGECLSLFGDAR